MFFYQITVPRPISPVFILYLLVRNGTPFPNPPTDRHWPSERQTQPGVSDLISSHKRGNGAGKGEEGGKWSGGDFHHFFHKYHVDYLLQNNF